MEGETNHLDAIINKVFSKDIQQKRAKKELQSLKDLDTLSFKVEVCESIVISQIPDLKHITFPIIFELLMDQNFPFNPPRVCPKTNFYHPSLADGRDYLHDIIQRNWNPAILLKDVINLLPKFLKRLEELPKPEESQLLGEFQLGSVYNVEDYISLKNAALFPGEEILQEKGNTVERFYILIESFFLSFEPVDKARNTIKLISWAHVQSIANIKKSREDPRKLVVTWIDKSKQSGVVQNVYLVDESKRMVELLIQAGGKYGVKVSRGQKKDLSIEEVTIKSYQDMNVVELLDNITFLESKLENEITLEVINLLMNLYQKAVEYFSAFNDPAFNDFVQRLHFLLQRPDVQAVLQSKEEEEQSEKKRAASGDKLHEEKKEELPNSPKKPGSPVKTGENKHEEDLHAKKTNSPDKKEEAKITETTSATVGLDGTQNVDDNMFAIENEDEEEEQKASEATEKQEEGQENKDQPKTDPEDTKNTSS